MARLNNRYEVKVVILELLDGIGMNRAIGDVYDNLEQFRKDKPDSDYKFGYVVVDTKTGYIPEECNEWNDTPEEAIQDYIDHIEKEEMK